MARFFALTTLLLGFAATASATIGFCNDNDASCAAWVRDGECEGDNGEHVKTICPHSCGGAPPPLPATGMLSPSARGAHGAAPSVAPGVGG